ncbi:hemerythrin domain-containing protein [Streptomyces sp. NPDC002889]|uniref:hemerythrin domain-containing protein n=1 Tax=Streptomyces sp. NPDC002889 TaxID=3364669 RepID=UPI00369DD989
MAHGGNVIEELMADHREVEQLFSRIEALPTGDIGLRGLVDEVTIELVRHSVAEEQYLYPAVREHVDGGAELADKEIAEHAEAEKLMKKLEQMRVDDAQFHPTLQKLMDDVNAHIRDEEGQLFPLLHQVCTPDALEDLGDKIRRAKAMAPTRPHPSAPDTPPVNKLLAPGAGLVDRVRDFVTGRGKS